MRNSAAKRIIAVLLCLVVFAGSELTGLTNIVGDLFAEETTTGTDDSDRDNVVEDVEVEAQSEEPQEDTEETVEEEPEEDPEPQAEEDTAEETVEPETEEPQEPQEIEADGEDDVTEEENKESDTDPADTDDDVSKEPVDDKEDKADTEDEKIEENNAAEETDKTQEDAAVVDDAKLPADEEQSAASETVTDPAEENKTEQKPEDEEEPEAFEEEYQDGQVVIHVAADPGVVPNGTELSVKKIVQQDVETLDDEEEIKEAEELNAKYEGIKSELELTVADDDTKEIAGFVAYDVNFLLTDEDGETTEIEPDGEVSVSMEFEEAYLPEEIAEKEDQIEIDSIDVIHMEEAEEDEESETGLKSEVVADADVSTTENAVEKAEFTTDIGRTFVITWTENDLGEREYICETEDATIKVTAAKGVVPDGALLKVVPILANNEATQKQYQDVEKKLLEKAETEKYEIAGFLAYDISFTDEAGAKLEPNGEVKVAIDYKKAAIPEDLKDLTSTTYALDDTEDAVENDTEQAESARTTEEKATEESGKEDETSGSDASQSETPAATGNITVMHLEENDQGQVTKVVDMGAEGKVTELNSTKDQKVTSTEFVTESFSTFTIVWTIDASTQKTVEIGFYKYKETSQVENGEIIGEKPAELKLTAKEGETVVDLSRVNLENGGVFRISDITENGTRKNYYILKDENGRSYIFRKARLFLNYSEQSSWGQQRELISLACTNGVLIAEGKVEGSYYEDTLNINDFLGRGFKLEIRFYYSPISELEPTLDTINNNDYGITMRMINYTDHMLQNKLMGIPARKDGWWNNGAVTQNVVDRRLTNGYPVMSTSGEALVGTKKGTSLAPLFGGESDPDATVVKANNLFIKDIYDETGYFEYSSFQNYAYLNNTVNEKGEHEFTVYKGIGTTDYDGVEDRNEYFPFYRGNFFPYSEIESGKFTTKSYNKYGTGSGKDNKGEELPDDDPRKGELLYRVDDPVYSFGMYVEAAFMQPERGLVRSEGESSPMKYEFTGDDDLWVFIDDSLVLDIGGAHHACSGSINFSDGTVKVGENVTNIRTMFKLSGYFPDGNIWEDSKVDLYFTGNTFKDFSTHRMKMFYMEHGEARPDNASNLQLKMNLPTINIEPGTVEVKKELDNTDKEEYRDDLKFAFQAWIENGSGGYDPLTNPADKAGGTVEFKNEVSINGQQYENVFYLKPDQVAVFEDLPSNRKYYVKEIGVESNLYDKVTIEGGTRIEEIDSAGGSTFSEGVESSQQSVESRPAITFKNKCSDKNSRKLRITKAMQGETPENAQFAFQVYLGGQQEPYKGPYVLEKANGTETKVSSSNGKIEGISVGDTIVIDQIMSGTRYKVVEVDLGEQYAEPTIKGKNVKSDQTGTSIGNESTASCTFEGVIALDYDAAITVTNSTGASATGELQIKKEMKEGDQATEKAFKFELKIKNSNYNGNYYLQQDNSEKRYQYNSEQKKLEELQEGQYGSISSGNVYIPVGYTAVIPGLEARSEFQVTENLSDEEKATYVYPPQMKVNGTPVSGNTVTASGTITAGQSTMVTVENSLKTYAYTWKIVKVGSASGTAPLKGAMFELTSQFNVGDSPVTYIGESGEDGIIVWKLAGNVIDPKTFQTGQYKLKETKAPENHMISGKEWTIDLTYDTVTIQEPKEDGAGLTQVSPKQPVSTNEYTYEFFNAVIYELPSTGGAGIFGYMISGVLLMMAGALVLYKRKYAGRC